LWGHERSHLRYGVSALARPSSATASRPKGSWRWSSSGSGRSKVKQPCTSRHSPTQDRGETVEGPHTSNWIARRALITGVYHVSASSAFSSVQSSFRVAQAILDTITRGPSIGAFGPWPVGDDTVPPFRRPGSRQGEEKHCNRRAAVGCRPEALGA